MTFIINDSLKLATDKRAQGTKGVKGGLILAKPSGQEFPDLAGIAGTEPWRAGIQQVLAHFLEQETALKGKQQDLSALASGLDNESALPVHLSNIRLGAKTKELGNESAALLQWGKSLAAAIRKQRWEEAALPVIPGLSLEQFRLVLEGLWFGSHQFLELKKPQDDAVEVQLQLIVPAAERGKATELQTVLKDLEHQIAAARQTLKLVLSPANICTPEFFSDFAAAEAGKLPEVSAEIWGESRLRKEGMNLLLAVGRGSPRESRLLLLDYRGDSSSSQHIAMVGKGVCFDTGGTNLKSSAGLKGMQYDMMGAGIVYGAFHYLASSGLKANLKAYIPLVENEIGCNAIKTGDIIKSAMGPTVEINNTDAEGRLILADAIYHAVRQKPKLLLDCATLTGAAIVALGEQCAAFYSNDDQVASLLAQAARDTGEEVWRMPLFQPYAGFLDSKLADMSNISTKSSMGGGSLTAALFLQKFAFPESEDGEGGAQVTDACRHAWVHLDLAGWSSLEEHPSLGESSRSAGVRLLASFVRQYAQACLG